MMRKPSTPMRFFIWVKENLFRAVAGVRRVGEGLAVVLGRGLELVSSLSHAIPI
jgi:hypothetical protein